MRRRPGRWARAAALVALATTTLLAGTTLLPGQAAWAATGPDDGTRDVEVQVVIPGSSSFEVTNAQLRWGINLESGAGAFFGGCNFLSAGAAGNAGSSRVWTAQDGFYQATSGAVRIERPDASGAVVPVTWSTRCLDPAGSTVSAARVDSSTQNQVVIDGGTGSVDQASGTATIRWTGSFTVAFYGGMTYWSATDPVLRVQDGAGTLTATVSGYGADMTDTSRWVRLAGRTVTLATLSGVSLGDKGFTVTPDYLDVSVEGVGQSARTAANAAYWGSFPQSFVEFQELTGQSAYWFTSGGLRDRAKVPTPLAVSYDAADPTTALPVATPATATSAARAGTASAATPRPAVSQVLSASPLSATPAFPATPATSVLAASGLIPVASTGPASLSAREVAALGALAVLVLAAVAALGLRRGWLVLPWRPGPARPPTP